MTTQNKVWNDIQAAVARKFRPLADNVLVARLEVEKLTAGGLHIPDTAQKKQVQAIVLAVGPGKRTRSGVQEPAVKVRDVVLLSEWGGTEVTIEDIECLILKEDDILAVVE